MAVAAINVLLDLGVSQYLATFVKAVTYTATAVSAGGVIFITAFSRLLDAHEKNSILKFVSYAASVGIVSSAIRIPILTAMLTGEIGNAFDFAITHLVLSSKEGPATFIRIVALSVIFFVSKSRFIGLRLNIALIASIIATLSFLLVGHASEVSDEKNIGLLPQSLLGLHLITVSFWLGSLWPLLRIIKSQDQLRTVLVMEQFSFMAICAVGVLMVAGLWLLGLVVDEPTEFFNTGYGQLFSIKIICFAAILALATFNKFRLTTDLRNGVASSFTYFRYSISAEIFLATLILVVTACFTTALGPGS